MTLLGYPGLPKAWCGDHVHHAVYEEPVAVIGDIHGQSDLLRRLLQRIGPRPVIVTGDVADRGPDSRGVIDLLVKRGAVGVLGNHDLWLSTWVAGEGFDRLALSSHGGVATLASYEVSIDDVDHAHVRVPQSHAE